MISFEISLDDLTQSDVIEYANRFANADYVRVNHGKQGIVGENLLLMARRSQLAKSLIMKLAESGMYAYMHTDNTTRFLAHKNIPQAWQKVKDGDFLVDKNGLIYQLETPVETARSLRLLVLFSSMEGNYSASLMRYFVPNHKTIQRFIPQNTIVLRIADFGGVLGSFYLNTKHRPNNQQSVSELISRVSSEFSVDKDDVVLYGASKGGTGSMAIGLAEDYKFVAVDPIVSDRYYEEKLDDFHFTRGEIYPERKESVFERLMAAVKTDRPSGSAKYVIVFSEGSPQYPYVESILSAPSANSMCRISSHHPQIKDHPDVAARTMNSVSMALNMLFYDLPIPQGRLDIDSF